MGSRRRTYRLSGPAPVEELQGAQSHKEMFGRQFVAIHKHANIFGENILKLGCLVTWAGVIDTCEAPAFLL